MYVSVEFLDEVQMAACNRYSNLNYKDLPTLFFEFHGSEANTEQQAKTVGKTFVIETFSVQLHYQKYRYRVSQFLEISDIRIGSKIRYDIPWLFLLFLLEEISVMNNGEGFLWAKDAEERHKLLEARHNAYYAALSLRSDVKVS